VHVGGGYFHRNASGQIDPIPPAAKAAGSPFTTAPSASPDQATGAATPEKQAVRAAP